MEQAQTVGREVLGAEWSGIGREMLSGGRSEQRSDIMAFTNDQKFNKEEALAWLKNEEERASLKMRTATGAEMVRAAHYKAEACAKLIKSLSPQKEDKLLDEPMDIDREIHIRVMELKEQYVPEE